MGIFHQIKAPRHGQNRAKACQRGDKGAGLDRPGVDQIGFYPLDDTPQTKYKLWNITPAEFALSTSPLRDFYTLRHGTIFHLTQVGLQAHVENLIPAILNCCEKAVVVGAVVGGEVNNTCHVSSTMFQEPCFK